MTTSATMAADDRARERRVASVVVAVVVAAARDARRSRLVVLDADAPESQLLARWLADAPGGLEVELVEGNTAGADGDALLLDPANKTVALLWPETMRSRVLPLADLYASQVARLAGSWSAPAGGRALIDRAGGIEAVDAFFERHLEERRPLEDCLAGLVAPGGAALRDRFEAGWWWRRRLGIVPKLGTRTLGIDLR